MRTDEEFSNLMNDIMDARILAARNDLEFDSRNYILLFDRDAWMDVRRNCYSTYGGWVVSVPKSNGKGYDFEVVGIPALQADIGSDIQFMLVKQLFRGR